jgi:hypothetical protein
MKERTETRKRKPGSAGGTPSTLRELGVPGMLAADLEAALRALGMTSGDRIVGYTFVTPDGARHGLRLEAPPEDPARDRAA